MFSREQSKKIREQFWIFFGKRYPRKWLLYNTGVKDLTLKFNFDTGRALVAIDSESRNKLDRAYYFDKICSLKNLMFEEISSDMQFEQHYVLQSGKTISRVYIQLNHVNIHNKKHWPEVFDFLNEYMAKLESFYLEYQDFIKG